MSNTLNQKHLLFYTDRSFKSPLSKSAFPQVNAVIQQKPSSKTYPKLNTEGSQFESAVPTTSYVFAIFLSRTQTNTGIFS
jgi:hypothetical protein